MNDDVKFENNPLHGVGIQVILDELVDHYGFKILFAYLNINCFKINPSIESSIKFLKKSEWAREKVEVFYLYQYKNLPRASAEQFLLPARERVVPEGDVPREPKKLSMEDAERLKAKREEFAATRNSPKRSQPAKNYREKRTPYSNDRSSSHESKPQRTTSAPSDNSNDGGKADPWASARKKHD